MQLKQTSLVGCYEVLAPTFSDARGWFTKSFQKSTFNKNLLDIDINEVFYSLSNKNVIRGMHFQIPPHDHYKLVGCLAGSAFDVIVDLRRGSSTYAQTASFSLKGGDGRGVFIPRGFAHGFCALEDNTLMSYAVSSEHDSQSDTGIHWNSLGIHWPTNTPIVSARDENLQPMTKFESPF